MKLRCPGCQAVLTLADDKIPAGKELKILCPRCKTPVEREAVVTDEGHAAADLAAEAVASTDLESGEDHFSALDLLDEKIPLAMVYISQGAAAGKVEGILREAGFYVTAASSSRQGLAMLNQHTYKVVVTEDAARQQDDANGDLLSAIKALPMYARRQFLLCVVSESLPTLDRLASFAEGVDLIINVQELENGKILLTRALQERSALYAVYNEEFERKGSA